MKAIRAILLLLALGLPTYGQAVSVTANKIKGSATAPSGACSAQQVQLTTAGVVYVCASGTWTSSGGGTTINSTNGQVPYRVNSTTFGDSAFASNALNSTYLSATSGASGAGLSLTVAGGGTNEALQLSSKAAASITLNTNSTNRWSVSSSGHFLAGADNTYDIGASGTTRPRNLYVGTSAFVAGIISAGFHIESGASGQIYFLGRTKLTSPADSQLLLQNNGGTDFSRLQFGGTSASFPALKRSSAELQVRLADDSAYAALTASITNLDKTITAGGTTGDQTINKSSFTVNFAAAATAITVTNSFVTANSNIICTAQTNDMTLKSVAAAPGSGSVVLTANAAATAETRVGCVIHN